MASRSATTDAAIMAAFETHGSVRAAARAMGMPASTYQGQLEAARSRQDAPQAAPRGELRAMQRERRELPASGCVKVYILTSAQNNTKLHDACWRNLLAYAEHRDAEVMVGGFTYNIPAASAGEKRKTSREGAFTQHEWWMPELEPHFVDKRVELAPGLVWCGELQILPTASDPIAGLESYTGRDSCIIPHVKFAVRSVPSPKLKGTKFAYTTGCVTMRNYIQKKAGQKAEFHHGYGGLIVEVCADGSWFVRQLNADSEGVIYDLDARVDSGTVSFGHRPAALVWGDIHVERLEPDIQALQWGRGGLLDALKPSRQVMHDVLDFRSQNHHDTKDPWKVYQKHIAGKAGVRLEVQQAADFLASSVRPWCETIVVRSNHDEAMVRWLKEADFRGDPANARFLLQATDAQYAAYERRDNNFDLIEWAFKGANKKTADIRFLRRDEEYIVCQDAGGGIELGMHGDHGPNGSRGTMQAFAKSGRKCIVGHSHSAGLHDGAMQVGVSASLDMEYNKGQSSWSHSHALVYPNGKRTLLTVWRGRWRGEATAAQKKAA